MKKTKESILKELDAYTYGDLRKAAFVCLRVVNHLEDAAEKENRPREIARIKIAQKLLALYNKEYDGI
jgi:hypothetical protein